LISIPHKLHVSALLKKNNYSIFIPVVAIWLWGLRNNYLFYNLRQVLKLSSINRTQLLPGCWSIYKKNLYMHPCAVHFNELNGQPLHINEI
jgi:hypothetical protein